LIFQNTLVLSYLIISGDFTGKEWITAEIECKAYNAAQAAENKNAESSKQIPEHGARYFKF
jgi:hypothetical protein